MNAITIKEFGGPENLILSSVIDPSPSPEELLVEVHATALNRADLMQRAGKYPPPAGASPIPGLEIAGKVISAGALVNSWKTGDRVFGLIPGGGYAEKAVIHQNMAMKIPPGLSFEEAAAIPEVFLTAYQAIFWLSGLQKKERILIHAGASGVGTAAIQLAKSLDATVFVTASAGKHEICYQLGADFAYDYHRGSFETWVSDNSDDKGVDVIIDFIGGGYFNQNLNCLATDGRLIQLATMEAKKIEEFDLRKILAKRLSIKGSTLRNRPLEYQIKLTNDLLKYSYDKFADKTFRPVIDSVFDWEDVQNAHRYMEANKNAGKIVLKVKTRQ